LFSFPERKIHETFAYYPPPHLNIFAGLVFCALILTTGQGFGETYSDGQVYNVTTAMNSAVTVSNATTLNWTYNASYPLKDKALTVTGDSTFYYNQNQEVLGNTSASFSGAKTKATLDYYTANSGGITINDGAVLNITNKANNGYGALLGNGGGGINTTSGSATLNLYGANTSTWGYASLRNNLYPINVGTNATLTVNGGLYNTYNATNVSKDLTKKGAGTLIVQHGQIGATHSNGGTPFAASTFIVEGGKVQLANGASIYSGATIQLKSGTTMDIESTAAKSTSVTFTGVKDEKAGTVSGGAVNVKGSLLSTGVTVSNGVTLTLSTGTALAGIALTLNKATLVVGSVNDVLYHQFNTSNVTDSTITANMYTTLDGKYQLNGTNTITSTANGHAKYGSFLFNGGTIKDEVINVQGGTTTITTPETSNGIRMRSAYSGFEVAANAKLVVNSNIAYDPQNTEGGTSATEIYKTGAGTMNLARGTIGGYDKSITGVFTAGNVSVKQGTLEISGTGMIYSGSTVNVDEGATLNFNSTNSSKHISKATYNVSGTMRIGSKSFQESGQPQWYSNVRGTVNVTGANALLDLAITGDPIGWGGTESINVTLKDGGTLTNSITRTAANDGSCQVTFPGTLTLEGGKVTSNSIGRQAANYGSYLFNGAITVQGDGKTSTMDAYMFQIRNSSLTIQPGATLEICSRVSSNGPAWNIDGGGTFRPITQTRTIQTDGTTSQSYTQELKFLSNVNTNFKNVTLDLTSLDTPITTTGKEWKLFSTAATDSLGGISSAGTVTTTKDTKIKVDLTVEDGKLVGQTLQANGFNINGSALELFLDEDVAWDQNANLLNGYKFFDDKTWGTFASIAVNGNLGELKLSLNADGNGFVAGLPEPSTWILLLVGVGGICWLKRRTSNK